MADTEADPVRSIDSLLRWVRAVAFGGALAFVAVVVAVLAVRQESLDRANAVIATRNASRIATCQVLDKMFAAHNNFVQTAINERQDIIDAGNANPNTTDAQKQASQAFFGGQIDNYRQDLLPIVDCNNASEVAALFTPTGG